MIAFDIRQRSINPERGITALGIRTFPTLVSIGSVPLETNLGIILYSFAFFLVPLFFCKVHRILYFGCDWGFELIDQFRIFVGSPALIASTDLDRLFVC